MDERGFRDRFQLRRLAGATAHTGQQSTGYDDLPPASRPTITLSDKRLDTKSLPRVMV